jgi:predicted TIM-barrel fold metal-dependent hydrolase
MVALDIAVEFRNVWVDTAWQPAEIIAEAARVIGPERVLFASDWPFLGNNIAVGLQRIRDCVDAGLLRENEAELILGRNAAGLLKLEV